MGDAIEPHLPPEVWELIFGNCSFPDLKLLRLVCHRLNAIVMGCPSFRRRCLVRFRDSQLYETNDPTRLMSKEKNVPLLIVRVDNDWSEFGQHVQNLSFFSSVVPVGLFFRMLRYCPHLKRLELNVTSFSGETVDNGFQLDFLEEFDVCCLLNERNWKRAAIIDLFGPVFHRLKNFSVKCVYHFKENDNLNLVQFIQSVQGTLQILSLECRVNLLKELCEMNQLHLKQLNCGYCLSSCNVDLWTQFCHTQQTLEEVSFMHGSVSNEILCATVQNLPNLKKLCAKLQGLGDIIPTFLSQLIRVEYVEICANTEVLNFCIPLSPSMKEFHLRRAFTFLDIECPTIQKLTLELCHLSAFDTLKLTSLKHLALIACGMSRESLDLILSCGPSLETVRLERMSCVCKETIAKLLNQSPKLREIVLCCCYGLRDSEEQLISHYYSAYGVAEGSRKVRFVIEQSTEDD